MRKHAIICVALLLCAAISGCAGNPANDKAATAANGGVELKVITPFSESDGNRQNFVTAYEAYEAASGNTIIDVVTDAVDEEWKMNVLEDFRNGNEPDVIFFFTGADANELIMNDKFVSISDIRKEYPDYAKNMKDSLMSVSTYDGRQYAVSLTGYWEGLFVNKAVLEKCGVEIPGQDYTWDQFIADCRTVRDNGYTPIAASLSQIPHYWFEYCVFNNGTVASHTNIPQSASDDIGESWVAGLNDIKRLYDEGFFPENTNEATDDVTSLMMLDDTAAFLADGSWKVGWFQDNAPINGADIDNYTVTYFPSKGERKPTDAIGGFSMGYYITKSAWNNPVKRAECVDFVTSMTTDEVTSTFGELTVTALRNGVISSGADLDDLAVSTLAMTKGCTAMIPAAQDLLNPSSREYLFMNISKIVTGELTAEFVVNACLEK